MSENRPPHLIHPDEVDAWLADSAVRVVTYHRTTVYGARSIIEHGVDLQYSRVGSYGQGFYTASAPIDEVFHDVTLTMAVRLRRPLVGPAEEIGAQVDQIIIGRYGALRPITPSVAATIRRQFIRLKYDGLVVRDAEEDGVDYVVAFFGASVKVVQP